MLHQIGVGALGPVFRTYEPARDRLVAVKVFRLDITPEVSQGLADELARAADAGLFHPSIVEPIAAGVQGTLAYRAEEYVPAESLDVAMRHYAPAPPAKVLPFITQIAGAIDFARASGIGHGALHPRDVFVTPDEARVTGFGVVDALERVGLRAPVRRPYTPPERVAGDAWGTAADVFSLAAIAFEMLTGRRPSGAGADIGEIKEAGAGPQAERLRAVLAQAMDEDPARRFPNALGFAEALEGASRGDRTAVTGTAATPIVAAPIGWTDAASPAVGHAATGAVDQTPAVPAREDHGAPRPPNVTTSATEPPEQAADDILAERDEDEAHWILSRDEAAQRAAEAGDLTPADRLAFDAADLALDDGTKREPRFAREIEPPPATTGTPAPPAGILGLGLLGDRETRQQTGPASRAGAPVIVPPPRDPAGAPARASSDRREAFDRLHLEEPSGESRIIGQRARPAMLPLAVALILGLLAGFAAGYTVASRAVVPADLPADAATGPTRPGTMPPVGDAPAAGKEWSEGTIAEPSPPATQGVPAQVPEVPGDAPAAAPAEPDAPAAAPRTGRLEVRSTPSRAAVTVNGKWSGRTPLSLTDLAFGDYVVRVVADGYRVGREAVTLSAASASRRITMRLEREPPPPSRPSGGAGRAAAPARPSPVRPAPAAPASYFGSVFVDSRPQGAAVFIDGKEYGKTPIKVPEVPIGSHVVRLELPDHRTWTTAVRVAAGAQVRVSGSLEPIR